MAIQEIKKKILFIPFDIRKGREVDTSPAPTMTLFKGSLRFSSALIRELSLNGKFVKFFYEPQKQLIGFQIREEISQPEMKIWKMVRQNEKSKVWTVSVTKLLKKLKPEALDKVFYGLEVKKYIEDTDVIARGDTFYFIELDGEPQEPRVYKKAEPSPVSEADLDAALNPIR